MFQECFERGKSEIVIEEEVESRTSLIETLLILGVSKYPIRG
ncbi:hypothetical protein X971_3779 [Agrobacterium tumefaciens LBA4213 (Ach5)]|nr:hypothetical protein X971_3779 [Agrobacterium tumefaciens LBA4213 (Ach5)]